MNSYILLDFDGVCTSVHETPGSYLNHVDDEYGPSPTCVEKIKLLAESTNSKIIIASNWRRFPIDGCYQHRDRLIKNPLLKLTSMLGSLCIGTLPTDFELDKAQALSIWLKSFKTIDFAYVILDDFDEGFSRDGFENHFVQTDSINGITDEDVNKAIEILNKQKDSLKCHIE